MLNVRIYLQDRLTSFRMILLSFILFIFTGALLLSLPCASVGSGGVSFLDALFTSTSAACVTGLVVFDTATKWTLFGRIVIMILIQIGGLGVVTAAVAVVSLTGVQIGIMPRIAIQDAVSAPQIGGVLHFMKFLIAGTFCIEGIGAVCLYPFFSSQFGPVKGIGYAVFHSVSAFCNAGFDLMGDKIPFSSLISFSSSIPVNLVIMALIVAGGLGFLTWSDLLHCRLRWRRYQMQTRIVLVTSFFLILLPALMFFFLEFSSFELKERTLLSLFQSVTTRTAGFNTADFSGISEGSKLLMIVLMLIGGSPGSTAGGMKTTTFAVTLVATAGFLRQQKHVNVFGRRIVTPIVREAYVLLSLYLLNLFAGTMFISTVEKLPVLDCMFECASALGTVGLTTGITTSLGSASKILLILFMYFGRVGGLTLAFSALAHEKPGTGKMPTGNIIVG